MQPGFEPFQDQDGNWRCGGKCNRAKPTDHPMVQYLVWEHDIPGEVARKKCFRYPLKDHERCKRHKGRPVEHGLRSKYRGTLLERIEAAKVDPELLVISNRVAVLAAAMDNALERIEDQPFCEECGSLPAQSMRTVDTLSKIVDRYASAVKKHTEITEGIKVKMYAEGRDQFVDELADVFLAHEGKKLTKTLMKKMIAELRQAAA